MDNLSELIYLLSIRDLGEDDVNSIANAVRVSAEDEELNWMDKDRGLPIDIEGRKIVELESQLSDWFAVSDKIDELHEQIAEWFADPPLPPFPYEKNVNTEEYFRWLDDLLANRPKGNYELLEIGSGWGDDNIHAVLVYRADMPRILDLCETLKFRVCPTKSMFDN
jgi:hypothetical protein